MNVLIHFRHGLGDAIQLTTVLQHLRKYRSHWTVDVSTLVGKHSAFQGLCNRVYVEGRDPPPCCHYQHRFDLDWHECHMSFTNSPSTKAERSLLEVFEITPDPELCRYSIHLSDDTLALARRYLERICQSPPQANGRFPAVVIHYEGNTSAEFKNLPTDVIRRLCNDIIEAGYTPIILDWDHRTPLVQPLPSGETSGIHCPGPQEDLWRGTGTGDAESIAALIELSSLMVGIDSGPLHVAGATSTPTLGVWTQHHPLHYFGHAENVTHLIPINHLEHIRGEREVGTAYFKDHYHFQTYRDLEDALRVAVRARLAQSYGGPGLIFTRDFWIRDDNGEQDLVVVQDVAEEDSYRIDEIPQPGPVVVDVGGHIGCFSKRLHRRNPQARIFAVECCPENLAAIQKNIGDFATVIPAAMTYEPDVALLNAVYSNCRSTGGSALIDRHELQQRVATREFTEHPQREMPTEYWADFRPIRTVTLEDLMQEHGFDRIDVLKLDCEGSEFSILGKTPSLDRIGLIVGEYHGKEQFEQLVADRFADWQLKILRDGDLGTFWLTNPNFHSANRNGTIPATNDPHAVRNGAGSNQNGHLFPFRNGTVPREHATSAHNGQSIAETIVPNLKNRVITDEDFKGILGEAFHPFDLPIRETWLPYYLSLFHLARELQPRHVVEIGVRAGYSALTFFLACPGIRILGIDADNDENSFNTHGGRKGFWRHAREILEPFDFQLLLADSRTLRQLPEADLIYVDGDHSYQGCLADLRLAERSTPRILTDDYDRIPAVRQACDTFTTLHPEYQRRYIDNGLTGFLLFERTEGPAGDHANQAVTVEMSV